MLKTRKKYKKTKKQNQKVLEGIKWEEKQKYNKNTKALKGGEQWQARSISQTCEIFVVLHFSSHFSLLSFWFLIYNAEFDLNSPCLDRLNNFGIISLQKLQNLLQKMRLVE